jgi:GTP-binding protein EngB required for normal cell division
MSDVEADFEHISHSDSKSFQLAMKNGTKIGIVGINETQTTTVVDWMKNALQAITSSEDHQEISWNSFKDSVYEKTYDSFPDFDGTKIQQKYEDFFIELERQRVDALVVSVCKVMCVEDKLVILFAQKHEIPFIIVTTGMIKEEEKTAADEFKKTFSQSVEPLNFDGQIFHITNNMKRKKSIKLLQHILEMNSSPFFEYLKEMFKKLYYGIISYVFSKPSPSAEAIEKLIQQTIKSRQIDKEKEATKKLVETLEIEKAEKLNEIKVKREEEPKRNPPFNPFVAGQKAIENMDVDDEEDVKHKQKLKEIEDEAQRKKEQEEEEERIAAVKKAEREQAARERKEKMKISEEVMEKPIESQTVTSPILQSVMQQFRQDSQERVDQIKALIAQSSAITLPSSAIYRQQAIDIDHPPEIPNTQMPNIMLTKKIENVIVQSNGKVNIGVIGLSMSGRNTLIGALAGGIWPDKIILNPTSTPSYDIYKLNYPNNGVIERSIEENVKIYEEFFQTMQMQNLSILLVTVYGSLRDNDYFIISLAQRHDLQVAIIRTKLDEWLDNTHVSKENYIQSDKKFIRDSLKSEKIEKMDHLIFNISALSYITVAEESQNCLMAKYLQDEPLLEKFLKQNGIEWFKSSEWEFLDKN